VLRSKQPLCALEDTVRSGVAGNPSFIGKGRLARNPSKIDARRGDPFLQATYWELRSMVVPVADNTRLIAGNSYGA
jgi:hypothetical protein